MLTVNFFGGPAVGKSTLAAATFATLKQQGKTAELVGEYAKELQYDRADDIVFDQLYLFAEQVHRLRRLFRDGRTDFAICDSPLLLNIVYNRSEMKKPFEEYVYDYHTRFKSINFYIPRDPQYFLADKREEEYGWAESKDRAILSVLREYDIPYYSVCAYDIDTVMEEIDRLC